MGGQACILYGGAQFSRDLDLLVLADPAGLEPVRQALLDLQAEVIAVPPFAPDYLARGHAIHFRSLHPDLDRLRIDLMAKLRGVAPFPELWARRTTIQTAGETLDLLALPDLVKAKKTQRNKDWPMLQSLLEQSYLNPPGDQSPELIAFWLSEMRTPELLLELAHRFRPQAELAAASRTAAAAACAGDREKVSAALAAEEQHERETDRAYWAPLKRELEDLRHR